MQPTGFFATLLLRLGIALCIIVPSLANYVPVVLWDGSHSENSPVDPFAKMSQEKFVDIANSKFSVGSRPVYIFWTDNFCLDDITKHAKDLEQLKSSYIIPRVESPALALESLFNYSLSTLIDRESINDGRIVVKLFDSMDSMSKMLKKYQKPTKDAVIIITGRSCKFLNLRRTRRAAESTEKAASNFFKLKTERFFLYADDNPILKVTNSSQEMRLGNATTVNELNGTEPSSFTVQADFAMADPDIKTVSLAFNIIVIKGYYYMDTISINSSIYSGNLSTNADVDIVWPDGFSYHCLQNTTYSSASNNVSIIFENLQVQAYETATNKTRFGDPYDCVGFTSIPIWSGIFVTAILALIMICGLTMLMDIRTMDRFDDPKGKTITISAQE